MNDETKEPMGEPRRSNNNIVVIVLAGALLGSIAAVIALAVWGSASQKECEIKVTDPYVGLWRQIVPSGLAPGGRLAHAAATTNDRYLYIHGGLYGFTNASYSDMWKYDEIAETWTLVNTSGDIPAPRFHHSMVSIDDNTFILFGGFNVFNTLPTHDSYDDFYRFDVKTMNWTRLDRGFSGLRPSKRGAHDAIVYGGKMYMFGGFAKIGAVGQSQEFWQYDPKTNTWTNLTPSSVSGTINDATYPAGRIGFAWAVVNSKAYMFGGNCPDGVVTEDTGQCSDSWEYDFPTQVWKLIVPPQVLGRDEKPFNRRSTNSDDSVGGVIYLYGGVHINTTIPTAPIVTMFDDLWAFDPNQNIWFEMHPNFDKPPRPPTTFGHSVNRVGKRIVIFGGRASAPTNPGSNQLWEYTAIAPQ
jgi:N-acetylneuraminic acid mutarotase